jgi:hypothetical protein
MAINRRKSSARKLKNRRAFRNVSLAAEFLENKNWRYTGGTDVTSDHSAASRGSKQPQANGLAATTKKRSRRWPEDPDDPPFGTAKANAAMVRSA